MKLKYKLNAIWLLLGFMFTLMTYYFYTKYVQPSEMNSVPILALLPAIIAVYYFAMPKINYIVIKDDTVLIHKSFVVFKNKIKISDIHHCKLMRKSLVIFTNNEDVYPIHLDWAVKSEIIEFVSYLSKHCRIEDQDENTFRLEKLNELL